MDQQAWLNWRRQGIGGSDASVIMGVNPWTTLYELYEEKALGKTKPETSAMKRGRDMEEPARLAFQAEFGVSVAPSYKVHEKHDWMRATIDGLSEDGKTLVEIKNVNKDDHWSAIEGEIPAKYYPQCQHYLMTYGLRSMWYWSFYNGRGVALEVKANDDYAKRLFTSEEDFWFNNVMARVAPCLTDDDKVDLSLDHRWALNAPQLKRTREQLDLLEAQEKELKDDLMKISKGKSAYGCGISLTKSTCQGAIDYKRAFDSLVDEIKKDNPSFRLPSDWLVLYRKESFTKWTVRDIQ